MAAKRKAKFQVLLAAVDKVSAPIRKMNRAIEKMSRPIAKLKRQMKSLAREAGFGKMGRAIAGVGKQFARLGLVGVIAVAGLFRALTSTSKAMDTLAKTTRALDFPVDEFQRWKQVSQLAGVGADSFDKSIQKLSKNIGELRLNTGTMSTILDKADPAFKKQLQNSKSNAEAFELVINKMRTMKNASDRAALANAAFGRAGKELINVANLSADEIAKMKAAVEANGGIISGAALQNAESFQDSLLLIKTAAGNVWSEIAGNLFPIVTKMMDGIRAWTTENKEMIQVNVTKFLTDFIGAGKAVFNFLREWIPPTIEIVKRFGGMKVVLGVIAAVVLIPLGAAMLTVGAAFASTAGVITLAIAAIVAAIALVVAKWDDMKAAFLDTKLGGMIGKFMGGSGGIASLRESNAAQGLVPEAATPLPAAAAAAEAATAPAAAAAEAATSAPAAGPADVALRIKIDQSGNVTGVEPETDSALEISTEGLAGEAF